MKIELSEASIKDAIHRVKTLADNIEVANELIVEQLIEKGEKQANLYHASAPNYGIDDTRIDSEMSLNGNNSNGSIFMTGPSSVYFEFGTGEEGAANGHPWKWQTNVPLNGYNSGPFVSKHINKSGRHYWIIPKGYYRPNSYVRDNGYTEGIPAGKVMYSTAQYIRFIKSTVVEKNLRGAIKKFNK